VLVMDHMFNMGHHAITMGVTKLAGFRLFRGPRCGARAGTAWPDLVPDRVALRAGAHCVNALVEFEFWCFRATSDDSAIIGKHIDMPSLLRSAP
jgi:hypothetical protein